MNAWALSNEEALASGYNYKVVIGFADIQAVGLTNTIQLTDSLPAGSKIDRVAVRVPTNTVGCTTATIKIGDGVNGVDANLKAANLHTGTAGRWVLQAYADVPTVFQVADTLDALFTSTTDNLSALSAGQVEIYAKIANLSLLQGGSATGGDATK